MFITATPDSKMPCDGCRTTVVGDFESDSRHVRTPVVQKNPDG